MPRIKPQYVWPITEGEPLPAEKKVKQRVTYKSGGKKFKESKPPVSLPRNASGHGDVSYGSHADIARKIKEEMLRLGL
jgi:hypothetical protein